MPILTSGDYKRYIQGQVTANGTTPVTFYQANLEQNSVYHLILNTIGGTIGVMQVTAKVAATATTPGYITWTSVAGNTSVYDVVIFP